MLQPATPPLTRSACEALDAADPLASLRERFVLPESIYLDGNSLGILPRAVADRVAGVVTEEWGRGLIGSWNDAGWIHLPRTAGAKIGRLIGAEPHSVVVADSTSVNLFKLLSGALRLRPGRRVILTEAGNFPSDLYMMQGLAEFAAADIEIRAVEPDELAAALGDDVALLCITQVNYRTGAMHDMRDLTAKAHAVGALVLWDLAHSAGAVELDLAGCGADLAIGCGYKFLNGGPGAPGFLYVSPRLQPDMRQPLQGWLGHARPFDFDPTYEPAPGVDRHLCGTPPVLSMAALDEALAVFDDVPMADLRAKCQAQIDLMLRLIVERLDGRGFSIETPPDPAARGSQVSLLHGEAFAICQALIARGVVGDYREPGILRFGITPLYLRYVDLWDAVDQLVAVMDEQVFLAAEFRERAYVT
ncbi:MAG: kynureninase [Pseudomonadota bacterium]